MCTRHRACAGLALTALLLMLSTACQTDPAGQTATVSTDANDGTSSEAAEESPPTQDPAEDEVPQEEDATILQSESSDSGDDGSSQGSTPQGQDLDIHMRTPGGVTLTVSRISFEGDDILVDAEVVNGYSDEVEIHGGNDYDSRLRLVDDADQEYTFIEGADSETIGLAPGETVEGTFAFRGPLSGEPTEISLVINVGPWALDGWNVDDQTPGWYPEFVVPIPLTWE
jgi:hypothetical protein